jgi:hypothetical protein
METEHHLTLDLAQESQTLEVPLIFKENQLVPRSLQERRTSWIGIEKGWPPFNNEARNDNSTRRTRELPEGLIAMIANEPAPTTQETQATIPEMHVSPFTSETPHQIIKDKHRRTEADPTLDLELKPSQRAISDPKSASLKDHKETCPRIVTGNYKTIMDRQLGNMSLLTDNKTS